MKYIKLFENENEVSRYWIVPTDRRLESALRKIGAPYKFRESRLSHTYARQEFKYFFIGIDGNSMSTNPEYRWGWDDYHGVFRSEYYDENGFRFEGGVNFNAKEKLKLEAEKYNL